MKEPYEALVERIARLEQSVVMLAEVIVSCEVDSSLNPIITTQWRTAVRETVNRIKHE